MTESFFPTISIDGEVIPRAAIIQEAQNHPAPKGRPGHAWRSAARALVIRTLLLRRAEALGITAAPKDVGVGQKETQEEALIRQTLETELQPELPLEAEVEAFYMDNPERFREGALYEASHILFAADMDDPIATSHAEARARAALLALAERPDRFATVAGAESDCPSAASGGRLGQFMTGDMAPEFEAALDELRPGEIRAEPLRSRFGWHAVRLDERAAGKIPPLEVIAPVVREAIEKTRWAAAARAYVERLLGEAQIEGVSMQDPA